MEKYNFIILKMIPKKDKILVIWNQIFSKKLRRKFLNIFMSFIHVIFQKKVLQEIRKIGVDILVLVGVTLLTL